MKVNELEFQVHRAIHIFHHSCCFLSNYKTKTCKKKSKVMELQRRKQKPPQLHFSRDNHFNSLFYILLLYIKMPFSPLKRCHNLNSVLMDIGVVFHYLLWQVRLQMNIFMHVS